MFPAAADDDDFMRKRKLIMSILVSHTDYILNTGLLL